MSDEPQYVVRWRNLRTGAEGVGFMRYAAWHVPYVVNAANRNWPHVKHWAEEVFDA